MNDFIIPIHDPTEALALADRLDVTFDGKVLQITKLEKVLFNLSNLVMPKLTDVYNIFHRCML